MASSKAGLLGRCLLVLPKVLEQSLCAEAQTSDSAQLFRLLEQLVMKKCVL